MSEEVKDGEFGQVISVEGENLKISMARKEACAKCRACVKGLSESEMILVAKNECNATLGDRVQVELDPGIFLKSALIVYGLPLVMMIAGFFIGMWLTNFFKYINPEVLGFLIGMSMMISAYVFISRYEQKLKKSDYSPKAVRIEAKFNETSK